MIPSLSKIKLSLTMVRELIEIGTEFHLIGISFANNNYQSVLLISV
jgi:hypothetical protein